MRTQTSLTLQMLGTLLLGICAASAQADTKTVHGSLPLNLPNFTKQVDIPQFDPNQGILNSVSITITSHIQAVYGLENTSTSSGGSYTLKGKGKEDVTLPDGNKLTVGTIDITHSAKFTSVYDSILDFGGPSGITFPMDKASQTVFDSPIDTSSFIGTGTAPFVFDGTASATGSGSGNIFYNVSTKEAAEVDVTYDYSPAHTGPPRVR